MNVGVAIVAAAALLAGATADEIVWSSSAYILYGDRTPLRGNPYPALTPLGAQQLYTQGSLFRARYIDNSSAGNDTSAVTSYLPIVNIEPNAIDNTQLSILSTNEQYVTSSALAFMQGLYPPRNQTFAPGAGGFAAAQLSNNSVIDFPLDGYQYPRLQSFSVQDPSATWIEGHVPCTQYQESVDDMQDEAIIQQTYQESLDFYQNLWNNFFKVAFPQSMANYYYAYELYDYALYHFTHDEHVPRTVNETDMAQLQTYAYMQQLEKNGNLTVSGRITDDMIRAVAGRMLAGKVISQLQNAAFSGASSGKLNLMFGSFETFISFFALASLADSPSGAIFETLPQPGAAMIFEMFSTNGNRTTPPSTNDLWVRFLYRPSTDPNATFTAYPIFGNGNMQTSMRLNDFVAAMEDISIDSVADWCNICGSINLYCEGLKTQNSGYSSPFGLSGTVSPVVAGVIGALVVLAIIGLAGMGAFFIGHIRFYRAHAQPQNGNLGGFKGPEKNASDVDVAVSTGGIRHERMGSWELRSGQDVPAGAVGAGASLERDIADPGYRHDDDDAMSELHVAPVKPRETV